MNLWPSSCSGGQLVVISPPWEVLSFRKSGSVSQSSVRKVVVQLCCNLALEPLDLRLPLSRRLPSSPRLLKRVRPSLAPSNPEFGRCSALIRGLKPDGDAEELAGWFSPCHATRGAWILKNSLNSHITPPHLPVPVSPNQTCVRAPFQSPLWHPPRAEPFHPSRPRPTDRFDQPAWPEPSISSADSRKSWSICFSPSLSK